MTVPICAYLVKQAPDKIHGLPKPRHSTHGDSHADNTAEDDDHDASEEHAASEDGDAAHGASEASNEEDEHGTSNTSGDDTEASQEQQGDGGESAQQAIIRGHGSSPEEEEKLGAAVSHQPSAEAVPELAEHSRPESSGERDITKIGAPKIKGPTKGAPHPDHEEHIQLDSGAKVKRTASGYGHRQGMDVENPVREGLDDVEDKVSPLQALFPGVSDYLLASSIRRPSRKHGIYQQETGGKIECRHEVLLGYIQGS